MSITSQITRIQTDRDTIRAKLVELGLASNTDNLDVLAESIDNIENRGSVSATVKEGETYTIPQGFHDGSGTVSGIAGGGNYSLQSKSGITPTKKSQQITSDDGYYGLSDVTVGPIPDAYQDVTSVTAAAGDVLTGKVIVSSTGAIVAGSMLNNGAVSKTLTTSDASYTVPAGYHNGSGKVTVVPETKTATPTKSSQDITASTGKVLSKVTVAAIPSQYQDVTGVTATADKVLTGSNFVDAEGNVVSGTMANRGTVTASLNTSTTSYTIPAGYHNGSGKVSITTETKTATPTKTTQNITPTSGKVLSKVTVNPIPDAYQDVTNVDITAADVKAGGTFVDATGAEVEGTMPVITASTVTLDATSGKQSNTIAKGYHAGTGKVQIVLEEKSATPTKSSQTITPTSGKVLSKVTVAAIPSAYQDVTSVTAAAGDVLSGKKIVSSTGTVVTGTMASNGAMNKSINGLTTTSVTIPAGYTTGGTVSLTSDIETALAAI